MEGHKRTLPHAAGERQRKHPCAHVNCISSPSRRSCTGVCGAPEPQGSNTAGRCRTQRAAAGRLGAGPGAPPLAAATGCSSAAASSMAAAPRSTSKCRFLPSSSRTSAGTSKSPSDRQSDMLPVLSSPARVQKGKRQAHRTASHAEVHSRLLCRQLACNRGVAAQQTHAGQPHP